MIVTKIGTILLLHLGIEHSYDTCYVFVFQHLNSLSPIILSNLQGTILHFLVTGDEKMGKS